jgi:nucleotide-binding universal stress UspA family protein
MTLVVPFDGTELSEAALVRASEFGAVFDEPVLAVAVVPKGNDDYACEKGWLDPGESFDLDAIVAHLRNRVEALAPEAAFHHEVVDRYAARGTISSRIRRVARDEDAGMVFVGSENAGRLVTSITSVGSSVASDQSYDVVIVRKREPSSVEAVREESRYADDPTALDP